MTKQINLSTYTGMEFYPEELISNLRRTQIFWCFGADQFVKNSNKSLRFRVNGLRHKGLVFIRLNGSDLFDVATTDMEGNVKEEETDIYIDMLLSTLDKMIECK